MERKIGIGPKKSILVDPYYWDAGKTLKSAHAWKPSNVAELQFSEDEWAKIPPQRC